MEFDLIVIVILLLITLQLEKNAVVMGVDMNSSIHQRNRDNEIYVFGRGEMQGITTVGPTITKRKHNTKNNNLCRKSA